MTLYPSMYNITPSIFMTSYPICMLSPYCFQDNTTTIPDIPVSWHRWHTDLYRCIAVSLSSQQVWKSSHLITYDFMQTLHHITFTLWHQWSCLITSQTLHSWHKISSLWHHIGSFGHHIHSFGHHTTLCITSSPLCLPSRPLYLCNHNLSTDITPTFVWHHTHLLCDSICTIYNITFNPYVITLLYLWPHSLYIWNHIQYVGQHIPYTCDYTATLCVITPTVSMPSQQLSKSSHLAYVWHYTHSSWHYVHTLWHQSSVFKTSQPLHSWHQISYLWHHIHGLWHLFPYSCEITGSISVT